MDLQNFCDFFVRLAAEDQLGFSLKGRSMTAQEVFADNGVLPAMAKRADQLALLCLGYGLGVSYEETDKAVLGYKMTFSSDMPAIVRLACIYDVLIDIKGYAGKGDEISLDELLYE